MEIEPPKNVRKRGKKYFPGKFNQETVEKAKPRGRKYIAHGYGSELLFRPHPEALLPVYTE